MIVWRGFGGASVALALLGLVAMVGLWNATGGSSRWVILFLGLGLVLGGVAGWLVAQWRNGPSKRSLIDSALQQRRAELEAMVAQGVYRGPGGQVPASHQEAQQSALAQYEKEAATTVRQWQNRDSVYGIPMRYASLGITALGAVVTLVGVINAAM